GGTVYLGSGVGFNPAIAELVASHWSGNPAFSLAGKDGRSLKQSLTTTELVRDPRTGALLPREAPPYQYESFDLQVSPRRYDGRAPYYQELSGLRHVHLTGSEATVNGSVVIFGLLEADPVVRPDDMITVLFRIGNGRPVGRAGNLDERAVALVLANL